MAGRLHPTPGFVIGQSVIQLHRLAQIVEGYLVVAFAVLQLTHQHGLSDFQYIYQRVVMNAPSFGYLDFGSEEGLFLSSRLGHVAHCGMGHGTGISHHGSGGAVEDLIFRKLLLYNFLPFAEADQHVLFHR